MRKWIGVVCIILGIVCLLAAIGFVVYNHWEAENAAQATQSLLLDVQLTMDADSKDNPSLDMIAGAPTLEGTNTASEMATIQVDGYDCIGILSVPVLELELPVLTDWSYEKLKVAPCHYYGSCYETDFVIAAHNYPTHFGRLSELQPGDIVIFTDVNGKAHCYQVELLETLPKEATKEMITSGFDLSLYTCTPGGGSRVTVRCSR